MSRSNAVKIRVTVLCARNLAKRDLFRLPDPFVRVCVDNSGQTHATESCKNTLDPKWNQHYDLFLSKSDSVTISVWDDKKVHKKKGAGFLGCVRLMLRRFGRWGTSLLSSLQLPTQKSLVASLCTTSWPARARSAIRSRVRSRPNEAAALLPPWDAELTMAPKKQTSRSSWQQTSRWRQARWCC